VLQFDDDVVIEGENVCIDSCGEVVASFERRVRDGV
jgi:predicted nucleic acid-binding Zn ribbon protein